MKIKLLDLFKRKTKFDKSKAIVFNGIDNLYAEKIERLTNNSVTAKTSSKIMSSYIIGKGFGEKDLTIVNKKKALTLRKLGTKISNDVAKHRGAWVHVMYNANLKIDRYNVLPYTHCRLGKKDSTDYNGKIVVYDNWDGTDGKIDKKKFNILDVFNLNEKVLQQQVDSASGIEKYKGQVLYLNLDSEYDYALGTIDAVFNDADSERQASIYKNRSLRKGFFGKTLAITRPLAGSKDDYDKIEDYKHAVSERDDFKDTIEGFLGAENSGGVLHVELEFDGEELDDAILIKSIKSDINDKMFNYTETSVFKNIMMAFNNIPIGLVRSDNALFSNSGDSLRVMKETYQENTLEERNAVEEVIKILFKNYKENLGVLEIIPLIDVQETKPTEE